MSDIKTENSNIFYKSLSIEFQTEGDNINLNSFHRLDILPPLSDLIEENLDYPDFQVVLSNDQGELLYSKRIHNPFIHLAESHLVDSSEIVDLQEVANIEDVFTLLLPDPGETFNLEIKNNPIPTDTTPEDSQKTFRFRINPEEETIVEAGFASQGLENVNGKVIGEPIQLHPGRDQNTCWNIVFLAEGYQDNDDPENNFTKFENDVKKIVDALENTAPFNDDNIKDKINPYRLNVKSEDNCRTLSQDCSSGNRTVRSFFQASFCRHNLERLLTVEQSIVSALLKNPIIDFAHTAIVLVNTEKYGGSGEHYKAPVVSTSQELNEETPPEVALHELGHSFFMLGDEYVDTRVDPKYYPLSKYKNLTNQTELSNIPWGKDIINQSGQQDRIPARLNNCGSRGDVTIPDSVDTGAQVTLDTFGLFEGGLYVSCGVFRSQLNCIMKTKDYDKFCVRCQKLIRDELSRFTNVSVPMV